MGADVTKYPCLYLIDVPSFLDVLLVYRYILCDMRISNIRYTLLLAILWRNTVI